MKASTYGTSYAAGSESWRHRAACRDEGPGLFFGAPGETQGQKRDRERQAKAVCARCPVRTECLTYALTRPEKHGTWGGLGENERARRRRSLLRQTTHDATVKGVQQRLAETLTGRAS